MIENRDDGIISFSQSNSRFGAIESYIYPGSGTLTVTSYEDSIKILKRSQQQILPVGKWIHLAVTSDSKQISVYIDSVNIFSFSSTGTSGETAFNHLGYGVADCIGKTKAEFDEFKIFNRNLSIEEIIYEKELKKEMIFEQPLYILLSVENHAKGLVHYWPMAGSTRDIINGKDLKIVQNGKLCSDRFGNKNSGKLFVRIK